MPRYIAFLGVIILVFKAPLLEVTQFHVAFCVQKHLFKLHVTVYDVFTV